jgi:signal transduction histidine kinase
MYILLTLLFFIKFLYSNSHIIRPYLVLSTKISQNMEGTSWKFFLLSGAIGTAGVVVASTSTDDDNIRDPREISAMMTQASEDIQKELSSQGNKLKNQLASTFGFNEIQSQLSLGYQFAFAGNTSRAMSHVEMADEALEKTIASVFRTAEEVTRISHNNSLTLDNGTRNILSAVGSSLTDLGSEITDQRSNLVGLLE